MLHVNRYIRVDIAALKAKFIQKKKFVPFRGDGAVLCCAVVFSYIWVILLL